MKDIAKIVGGTLIFAGTCIGAGMLALPLITAKAGFMPSALIFVLTYFFMIYIGFLFLEANIWLDADVNMISMAGKTLGISGVLVLWITYLVLMYAANAAYIDGSLSLIGEFAHNIPVVNILFAHNLSLNHEVLIFIKGSILCAIIGAIIYCGTKWVDKINRLLMIGLFISYALLIYGSADNINLKLLQHYDLSYVFAALPLIIASFTGHMVIPSLRKYLASDIKSIKLVIIIGCTLPLIAYLLWELVILGVVPLTGEHGFQQIIAGNNQVGDLTSSLASSEKSSLILYATNIFSFCALITSFFGMSLSLKDFLCDGFHWQKNNKNNLICIILALIPPLVCAALLKGLFTQALSYAGIMVCILLIIMPALMVWVRRYVLNIDAAYQAPGGKVTLIVTMLVGLFIIIAHFV